MLQLVERSEAILHPAMSLCSAPRDVRRKDSSRLQRARVRHVASGLRFEHFVITSLTFLSGERIQAATARVGGAMNSGPIGSLMLSRRIRLILALVEASTRQPAISSIGNS